MLSNQIQNYLYLYLFIGLSEIKPKLLSVYRDKKFHSDNGKPTVNIYRSKRKFVLMKGILTWENVYQLNLVLTLDRSLMGSKKLFVKFQQDKPKVKKLQIATTFQQSNLPL